MNKIKTYVSSATYDSLLDVMYPDEYAKDRTLQEVERLIVQGHTVEYRFGNNLSTVLDIDKFNDYIRPKYTEQVDPINIQEVALKAELETLSPAASVIEEVKTEETVVDKSAPVTRVETKPKASTTDKPKKKTN